MTKLNTSQSAQWRLINKTQLAKERLSNLKNFKNSPANFKLALWDPKTNGVRYLKTLIYNLSFMLSRKNWEHLAKIKKRYIGNPITITYNKQKICLDYIQAVLEIGFIVKKVNLDATNILEIGAGYGRTCHAIVSNFSVSTYTIVDLENSLELSKKYLAKVLEKRDFDKVDFVLADKLTTINNSHFDLAINIDSFAEMDTKVVTTYLNFIDSHCENLYVKNPVGKYLDPTLDNHVQGKKIVNIALTTGILRDIIDIQNNLEVKKKVKKFVAAYRPSVSWKSVANSWSPPWSHYWQSLYSKSYHS